MFGIRSLRHLSVALLASTISVALPVSQSQNASDGAKVFIVMLKGVRVGSEQVTVTKDARSFKISSTGQIAAPIDLITSKFELTYSADWQPVGLSYEGAINNETLGIGTTFGLTTATNDLVQGPRRGSVVHQITPRTVVLPVNVFAAYEGLAARLPSFQIGARFPAYIAPEGEIAITLNRVTLSRISSPAGIAELKEYDLTLHRPGAPMSVQVLVDANGRLARVVYRDLALAAIREEFATVMAREVRTSNLGDENAFIPASGFNLAATVTKPDKAPGKSPAVILVGGPGRQDRDETMYGVSIFGQLAGRLAEAGYFVVRFDKRGVGQSGGRPEHASLTEYAEDVAGIVTWLRKRKDIDPKRIAVLTHAEGSAVGMLAAAKDKNIRALGMMAAPGTTGREVVLEQQRLALSRGNDTTAEREAKVALQNRVINAVITGKGLDELPPDVQRRADTPMFKSWLLFDPAVPMKKINQPLLIVDGALDTETPPANGERLAALGSARKDVPPTHTTRVVVPKVNHLLLEVRTGELEEYDALPTVIVSPDVVAAVVSWLKTALK
jgi:pimeloyl-ACP methyl ester carboxylesterase